MTAHPLLNRRQFLGHSASALSAIGLAQLLAQDGHLRADTTPIRPRINPANPNARRASHFPARARNVLMIFCSGACSPLDTFDYKPDLIKYHGQPLPGGESLITFQGEQGNLTQSPWPLAHTDAEKLFLHALASGRAGWAQWTSPQRPRWSMR